MSTGVFARGQASSAMIKYLDADGLRAFVRETMRVLRSGGWFAMGEFGRPVNLLGRPAMGAMGVPVDRFRTGGQQAAVLGECGLLDVKAMGMARVRRIPLTIEGASGRKPD